MLACRRKFFNFPDYALHKLWPNIVRYKYLNQMKRSNTRTVSLWMFYSMNTQPIIRISPVIFTFYEWCVLNTVECLCPYHCMVTCIYSLCKCLCHTLCDFKISFSLQFIPRCCISHAFYILFSTELNAKRLLCCIKIDKPIINKILCRTESRRKYADEREKNARIINKSVSFFIAPYTQTGASNRDL